MPPPKSSGNIRREARRRRAMAATMVATIGKSSVGARCRAGRATASGSGKTSDKTDAAAREGMPMRAPWKFLRDDRGSVAVEMAIAGNVNDQVALFQRALCNNLGTLLSQATCNSNVVFEVEPYSSFGGMTFQHDPPCTHNATSSGSGVACPFNLGSAGQIVGVEVRYWRPFIVPWIGGCLSGGGCWAGDGTAPGSSPRTVMQTSVVVFRYQPSR